MLKRIQIIFILLISCTLWAQPETSSVPEGKAALELAKRYMSRGIYNRAIDSLRIAIIQSGSSEKEMEATFLLGKAFLLNHQVELAETTFSHLKKNWPGHPYQAAADFLQIQKQLEKHTTIEKFPELAAHLLDFPPFGLDLDFFDYLSGFSKGYVLQDYLPVKRKLLAYFDNPDRDLSTKARLLDALVESFDFHNPAAIPALEQIARAGVLPFSHTANLALMFLNTPDSLHNLALLERFIPKDYEQTRQGWLCLYLKFLLKAYIAGDYEDALSLLTILKSNKPDGLPARFDSHESILKLLIKPMKTTEDLMALATGLESYSALYPALRQYKELLSFNINATLKGRIHYLIGRIYQDDLRDLASAHEHFIAARKLGLPPELNQELDWRILKSGNNNDTDSKIRALASADLPFTEAAILEQLGQSEQNPAAYPELLNRYYQTLQNLNLEPSSQIRYLKKLAQLAQQSHQYAKARFFLIQLARYDSVIANQLLEENNTREKMFLASRKQFFALEPEKQLYLQGQYLYSLGEKEKAREILEGIVKKQSIFAEKAKFELFRQKLSTPPYSETEILDLTRWYEASPDPEIRVKALKLLIRQYQSLFSDYSHLEEERQSELLKLNKEPFLSLLNKAIHDHPEQGNDLYRELFRFYLAINEFESAEEIFRDKIHPDNSVEELKLRLLLNQATSNHLGTAQICEDLAKAIPEEQTEWLHKAFQSRQLTWPEEEENKTLKTLQYYEKHLHNRFFSIFAPTVIAFCGAEPENEAAVSMLLSYQTQWLKNPDGQLFPVIKSLIKSQPEKKEELTLFQLRLLQVVPSRFAEPQLIQNLKEAGPAIATESAKALAAIYSMQKENMPPAKQTYLKKKLQELISRDSGRDDLDGYLSLLSFELNLLSDFEKATRIKLGINDPQPEVRNFYLVENIHHLLDMEQYKEATSHIKALVPNKAISPSQRMKLYEHAFDAIRGKERMELLKQWSLSIGIDPRKLSPESQDLFYRLTRKINALTVIKALKKEINWDDPQEEKNFEKLMRITRIYQDDLQDMRSALELYYQIQELFPKQARELNFKNQRQRLIVTGKALELEKENTFSSLLEAGNLWLEELEEPTHALELFKRANKEAKTTAQQHYTVFRQIRCLISLTRLDEAENLLKNIPRIYEFFNLALLKQIQAARALSKLPPVSKANTRDLIRLARLYLEDMQDLEQAEKTIQKLHTKNPMVHLSKETYLADLHHTFYHTAMGVNRIELALSHLKQALGSTRDPESVAKTRYLLGAHFSFNEPNIPLAISHLKQAVNESPRSEWAQLALLLLVDLHEQSGQHEEALKFIRQLKEIVQNEASDSLSNTEAALQKSLVFTKLEEFKQIQHDNPKLILQTARALARNPEYFSEAESKYLLYTRLCDKKELPAIHLEICRLYLEHNRLEDAMHQALKSLDVSTEITEKFDAGLMAYEIAGLKIQNFEQGKKLYHQLSRMILNKEQSKLLELTHAKVIDVQSKQKKISLKNLSYNHFPEIARIKTDYYKNLRYKDAAEKLEQLLEQTENYQLKVGIHYEIARLYDLKLKDHKSAYTHYLEFFEKVSQPEVSSEVLLRIAQIEDEVFNDSAKARKSYELYLEKFPSAKKRLAVQFKIAQIYANREREYSRALDIYTDISNAYPQTESDIKARLAKGDILRKHLSDYQGAIDNYRELVDIGFDSSYAKTALLQIAQIYEIELNEENQAIMVYEELIARFPNSSEAATARNRIEQIKER